MILYCNMISSIFINISNYMNKDLESIEENCGFHVCPVGMKCCLNCDIKGNLFPTGQCVDPFHIDFECPLTNCKRPIGDSTIKEKGVSKTFLEGPAGNTSRMNFINIIIFLII